MDILNNSIVTDADTEVLDSQITQISNDFAETYYLDNEQQEELEMLVAKAMKLGELYERKKWQAAKAQSDKKIKLLLCDEHLQKCESPTGVFNSQYPDEEPCLICLAKEAKAQAAPGWISVEDGLPPCDFEFCETGECVSNAVLIHSAATYGFNMGMGHVNEDGVWNVYSGEHDFMNVLEVTHWMPLPDAPKVQEQK